MLAVAVPTTPPPLGFLLGGFTALVLGLAVLSRTRPPGLVVPSPVATRRAIGFALVFALTAACFSRIWRSALAGVDHSLWLFALGDVLFVTLGLFAWFLVLVEDIPTRVLGLHWSGGRRALWAWLLCIAMPIVASLPHYLDLWSGRKPFSMDACVFGALYAAGATSVPQEILFRGYMQSSLSDRMSVVARIAFQAVVYALFHLGRLTPGVDMAWSQFFAQAFGLLLPAGLFWGAMRELGGGSILPLIVSHFLLRFGEVWNTATP